MEENQTSIGEEISSGKRKLDDTVTNDNENDPKIPKLDDVELPSGASQDTDCLKSIDSDESIPAAMDDENIEDELTPKASCTESSALPKTDEPNSSQKVQRDPDWEFANVLRTERPFLKMGTYSKFEVQGIIPDIVLKTFTHERHMRYRQLRKDKSIDKTDVSFLTI